MDFKRISVVAVGVAAAVMLMILFGGQKVYNQYMIAKPIDKAFADIRGIENVAVDKNSKTKQITVAVSVGKIDNLQQTYNQLQEAAVKTYGTANYRLVVRDSRTPVMSELLNSLNFILQEGLHNGQFTQMERALHDRLQANKMEGKIYIDNQAIYLQIHQGEANLYEIIERSSKEVSR